MVFIAPAAAAVLMILYRRGHMERKLLLILLALDLIGGSLSVKELIAEDHQTITELPMNTLEEAGSITLDVETDAGEQYALDIDAPEQIWPEADVHRFLQTAAGELEAVVLGNNASFDRVEWNLNLPDELGEAPVQIEWYTDQPDFLDFDGIILPGVPEKGVEVNLTAELSLQDQTETWQRKITVFPTRETEQIREEILYQSRELNKNASKEETVYRLPEEAAGRKLSWSRTEESGGGILSVLALIGGCLSVMAGRERAEKERAAQQEELLKDYPELLSKIQLYLSTGLGMRTIFKRISGEYQARIQNGSPRRHAYEAVGRAVHQMESGVTELEAYDEFGKMCGIPCYRGLALLLAQNLKKGGAGIMPQLEREVQESFETRKRRARAEGEKTTVRLLLPMAMMLMVVMGLILIPAFLSI